MIKRYIDADELIEFFDSYPDHIEFDVEDIKSIINEQDDADVRENVKGEWIFTYGDKKYKRCSSCGKTFYSIPSTSNFCPNCGAQMVRGES